MPKKKGKDTQAEQSRRFVETAKALGVDESGRSFDAALATIAKPLSPQKPKSVSLKKRNKAVE